MKPPARDLLALVLRMFGDLRHVLNGRGFVLLASIPA
jgi:hypothetical protein